MKRFLYEWFSYLLFLSLIVLMVAFPFFKKLDWGAVIKEEVIGLLTIFFSILLEAFPFLLIGAIFSALIGIYIKPTHLSRWLPKHPILSIFPALLLALILPICECAIVPVIRRFIKKGMPVHVAVTFMTAAPILNPVVAASTYYAFNMNTSFLVWRMVLALLCSMVIAITIYFFYKKNTQINEILKENSKQAKGFEHEHDHKKGIMNIIDHTSEDFLFMAKFFIIGAFLASIFQIFFAREWLGFISEHAAFSIILMMLLSYILSLCSEADAFIAASFGGTFSFSATLSFLILGPMLDLKNTLMMMSTFKWRFIIIFHFVVFFVVFTMMIIFSLLGMS
ncbi:hypothetical protein BTS2_4087 [Bacillus sp. TS-2]|nr:hypothetical protein BTS2_4087 [Bacillus sp. TS-2]